MDSTDIQIHFDENGICDHCNKYFKFHENIWKESMEGRRLHELEKIAKEIRKKGANNKYDCFLGLSGGLDSSYMLHYVVTELGLRPLVFHVDTGWNSKDAVENIYNLVTKLNLDLQVKVIDWDEMRELQLAFFRSGLSNIDVPQDHAFMATLYDFAEDNNIKYLLNGGNISTEALSVPLEWMYYQSDVSLLRDVARKYMRSPLNKYPTSSALNHKFNLRFRKGIKVLKALDYIPYVKADAEDVLKKSYGWHSFSNKHYESIFTRFYEGYWLPKRYNFDTRKITLSSMILTGQIERTDALEKISLPALSEKESALEINYIAKKLQITSDELLKMLSIPFKTYKDFRNQNLIYRSGAWASYILKQDISGAKR
jgi:N-acetyl sugar amidotransferase